MVDLPEPDNPVSQITNGLWPFSSERLSLSILKLMGNDMLTHLLLR